ncbi:MAG: molybdate ABC transporter substrate-binding protein [Dehalococcoidia bacterium]|nr:molybdate ABC transporter substrate-binding protein [Dehalococcoidia bacterium]
MTTSRLVQFTLFLLAVLSFTSCGVDSGEGDPLIFAAASLADVLDESADLYESETGKRVEFSFGGSIALANQVASFGAPADGFFFVGERPIAILESAGLNTAGNRSIRLHNALVVIGSKGDAPPDSLGELAATNDRVAIGDPALAPAGVYAREALKAAGAWDEVSSRAIYALDVRAAMAAVESGNARYGIVYRTDALRSSTVSTLFQINDGHTEIEYLGSALEDAPNAMRASEFLEFIANTPETRTLFESAGFSMGVVAPATP